MAFHIFSFLLGALVGAFLLFAGVSAYFWFYDSHDWRDEDRYGPY